MVRLGEATGGLSGGGPRSMEAIGGLAGYGLWSGVEIKTGDGEDSVVSCLVLER